MKVYVVTAGSYSDFGNIAVFSSEEKANKFMKEYPRYKGYDSYNNLEIYELDEPDNGEYKKGKRIFEVKILKDGTVEGCKYKLYYPDKKLSINIWIPDGLVNTSKQELLICEVEADNPEGAVKIANERRAMLIASGEWENLITERYKKCHPV
jgi:hypothetical protein